MRKNYQEVLSKTLHIKTAFFRRRNARLPIGQAITDLLIVRHRLRVLKLIADEIAQIEKLSPQQKLLLQQWWESLLPDLASLYQRYEESVKAIAGIRPVLAFRVSELDKLLPAIAQLRGLALTDEKASAVFHDLSPLLTDLSRYDKLIRTLAWNHGYRTWYEIRGRLQKPLSLPPNYQKLLESLKPED